MNYDEGIMEMQKISRHAPATFVLLIGLPGSGKSTWRADYLAQRRAPLPHVVSTDDSIEEHARHTGIPYDEAFLSIDMALLVENETKSLQEMLKHRVDVLVDRTNLTFIARQQWLSLCPVGYTKVGIMFNIPTDIWVERLANRLVETGKSIPVEVLEAMISGFEPLRQNEFDHIINIHV